VPLNCRRAAEKLFQLARCNRPGATTNTIKMTFSIVPLHRMVLIGQDGQRRFRKNKRGCRQRFEVGGKGNAQSQDHNSSTEWWQLHGLTDSVTLNRIRRRQDAFQRGSERRRIFFCRFSMRAATYHREGNYAQGE
jgi:hypothetical protein